MKRLAEFVRRERLYLLLLAFILTVNVVTMVPSRGKGGPGGKTAVSQAAAAPAVAEKVNASEAEASRRAALERAFAGNPGLAMIFGLTSLLIIAVILLGVTIDIILAAYALSGRRLDISTYRSPAPAGWGVWDVAKVAILFLFFGYIMIMVESVLVRIAPVIRDDNFRMIFNSSVLDALAVVLILYFAVIERKEKLEAVGVSLKNFTRNVFYGIVAYIAIIPVLVAALAVIAVVVNAIKYVPQKQPVVELFLKEKNASFLFYTSLFAAVAGPVIEELFFRGFMYNAFKKRIGVFAAMVVTAGAFAALHAHAVGFVPIMILGMLLAYMYEKTGTLVSSITVHAIHNLSMVLMVFLVKQLGAV